MSTLCVDIPEIETERLRFRAPSMDYFEEELAFYKTDRSAGVGGPLSEGQVWRTLTLFHGHWLVRGYGFWALEEKETGRYVGRAGCFYPQGWPEPEIGWVMMGHGEGRGLAFEAATAARAFAYETLGWKTAISLILPTNERSIRLAERLGAIRDGEFQHETHGAVPYWRHPGPDALAAGAAA